MPRKDTVKSDSVPGITEALTDSAGVGRIGDRNVVQAIPPLHSLVAFEAIARHKGISAAARDLGVTRSALSHSIGLLEHRLQVRLLRRTHPVVDLTRAGESYLLAVQNFATTLGDALYGLSPDARATLRLAVCPEFARLWLGSRLPRFHELYPRIDLNVTVSNEPEGEALRAADVVIKYESTHRDDVVVVPLWRESVVAVAAPALAERALAVDLEQIHAHIPLIEVPQFSWSKWHREVTPRVVSQAAVLVAHDVVHGLEMAVHGMGIVLAPQRLTRQYVKKGRLTVVSRQERSGACFDALSLESNAGRQPVSAFLVWLATEAHDTGE